MLICYKIPVETLQEFGCNAKNDKVYSKEKCFNFSFKKKKSLTFLFYVNLYHHFCFLFKKFQNWIFQKRHFFLTIFKF